MWYGEKVGRRVSELAEEEGRIDVLAALFGVSLGTLPIAAGLDQAFGTPTGTGHITTRP